MPLCTTALPQLIRNCCRPFNMISWGMSATTGRADSTTNRTCCFVYPAWQVFTGNRRGPRPRGLVLDWTLITRAVICLTGQPGCPLLAPLASDRMSREIPLDRRLTAFSFEALVYVAVRIINFQITTGGVGNAVWNNHEVHAIRVFGRGTLESGNSAGIADSCPVSVP